MKKDTRDKSQLDKFIEAARQHGCDESDDSYDTLVKQVAEQPPQPRKPKKEKHNDE